MFTFIKKSGLLFLYFGGGLGAKVANWFGASRTQRQIAAAFWLAATAVIVGPMAVLVVIGIVTASFALVFGVIGKLAG